MVSVAQLVERTVRRTPFLDKALTDGIINYSALARIIRPQAEKELQKEVRENTIAVALRRLSARLQKSPILGRRVVVSLKMVTVVSGLWEFTYANSTTIIKCGEDLLGELTNFEKPFCTLSCGSFETTLLVSAEAKTIATRIFSGETLVSEFGNLVALAILLPKEAVKTPGVYYSILKTLAWEEINIIEVFSTFTEFILVLRENDLERAISLLREYLVSENV